MTEGNGEIRGLLKGWLQLKLEDVAEWGSGGTPSRKNPDYFEGDIPWIKTGELKGKYIRNTEEKITEEAISESSAKIFPKGSVAIAMYGATIGKTSILDIDASTNQACAVAKPFKEILLNEFLYYYLYSQTRKFIELGKGGAQPNISQTLLKSHPIYLPPLNEQERIVEKIEELFSDVDQGIESLRTAQKQLKVYRQAVLKWAFEGKLTEAWRSQQPTLKTGEALLAQIKAERENRYQKRLAEWEEKVREWEAIGKAGKKPTKPQTPKEPSSLTKAELVELPKLPEGWCWAKVGLILLIPPSNGHSVKDRKGGFKVLRLTAIRNGLIDIRKSKEGDWDEEDAHPYIVQPGDFLLARGNGSINLVGAGGLVSEKSDVAYPDTMIKLIIDKSIFISKLFALLWNSAYFRKQIEKSVRTTAGIYKINQNHINNFLVPLTPINEQGQIAEEIESRLSICDQLEATIIENLQKAEALRQSILKQAFEGKLVPQDPNDEPAEKLLERIRAERQEKESQKTSKPLR